MFDKSIKSFNLTLIVLFLFTFIQVKAQTDELPAGFSFTANPNTYDLPIGIRFDEKGKHYIWEKKGLVWIEKEGTKSDQPFLNIEEEVGNLTDLGLLGFELDPNFYSNGYVYAYYFVDNYYLLNYGTPDYDANKDDFDNASIMRLARFTADPNTNFETIIPGSKKILLGKSPENGIPILHKSHAGGDIIFGRDGSLLVATGDGTTFEKPFGGGGPPYYGEQSEQAIALGIIEPREDKGSFRSQMLHNLNGKILRIDAETGSGLPSNPFYDESNPNADISKVWQYGLRNPYRMTWRPNTGSLDSQLGLPGSIYIADVGGGFYEELNIARVGGNNYGWPVFEGYYDTQEVYQALDLHNEEAPNPLYDTLNCKTEYFPFFDLVQIEKIEGNKFLNPCDATQEISTAFTSLASPAVLAYKHIQHGGGLETTILNVENIREAISYTDEHSPITTDIENWGGNCLIGGSFYDGLSLPEKYHGAYFFGDFDQGWVRYAHFDLNDEVLSIHSFYKDTTNQFSYIVINPNDECLYLNAVETGLFKICYEGNVSPIAAIEVNKSFGVSPLEINFDGTESYDPDGDPISYSWDFGDGTFSSESNPKHSFHSTAAGKPEKHKIILTVTDDQENHSTKSIDVYTNNTPPKVNILGIENEDTYSLAGINIWHLSSDVIDAEHDRQDLKYTWESSLHHNNHQHIEVIKHSKNFVWEVPPIGCDGEIYYYTITLKVSDPLGLEAQEIKKILPACVDPFFKLIKFDGAELDNQFILNWEVSEPNGLHAFELWASYDEGPYKMINEQEFKQTTFEYSYVHNYPNIHTISYRLKLIGDDGIAVWSSPLSFNLDYYIDTESYISPNPVNSELTVHFNPNFQFVNFKVFNISGKLIFEQDYSLGNRKDISIHTENWLPGNYFFQAKYHKIIETGSFSIIKMN